MDFKNKPIGIFDSGIGGLSLVREMLKTSSNESIVYFGDTARLPYGSKSEATIKKFCVENARFLLSKDVKAIVIACNTASAVGTELLRQVTSVPIIGVVECGAISAVRTTKNNKIGVIGTSTTIRSRAYSKHITRLNPDIQVYEQATPLLVHLVEENWGDKEITLQILKDYLSPLLEQGVDTLVLGCTHYPFLSAQIRKIAPTLTLVDPAVETIRYVKAILSELDLTADIPSMNDYQFYLSDVSSGMFTNVAKSFLDIEPLIQEVKIEELDLEKTSFEIIKQNDSYV